MRYDANYRSEIFAKAMGNQFTTTKGSAFTEKVVKETLEHHNNEKYIKNLFYSPA